MDEPLSVAACPNEFVFVPARTALMVIDMQRDFCEAGGFATCLGNDVEAVRQIIPLVARVIAACRAASLTIIHTREGHDPDLSDCPPVKLEKSRLSGLGIGDRGPLGRILVRGEYGHDFIDECRPTNGEIVIDKPGKGAFFATNLGSVLEARDISTLLVVGVTTNVCVHSTVREATDRGYACLVLANATAAYDLHDHDDALRMVSQQGGIFGWVGRSEDLLASLELR